MRQRGLDATHVPEAVRLYDDGMTLMDVGLRFGARPPLTGATPPSRGAPAREDVFR